MTDMFTDIAFISAQLDRMLADLPPSYLDHVRVSKLQEEAGEAYTALLNWQGLNPRKGVCGTQDKLREELADVAITALGALQHFTGSWPQTERILNDRVAYVATRLAGTEAAS